MLDLKAQVVLELRGRSMAELDTIAKDAGVSASMLGHLSRGKYRSSPAYDRLNNILAAAKKHPKQVAA